MLVECVASKYDCGAYQRQQMESLMESDPRWRVGWRDRVWLDRSTAARDDSVGAQPCIGASMRILAGVAHRVQGRAEERFALPMSRYDIADYLAIAVETVSRSLTTLRSSG